MVEVEEAMKRLALMLLAGVLLVGSQKGDGDESNRIGLIRSGSDLRTAVQFTVLLASELGYLRPGPVPHTEGQVSRVTGRQQAPGGLAEGSGNWNETHRIFVGSDGPVLISRSIAPDPDFWAGVGVAGCESAWRAAVDSPTGDTGFWQLNRRWQEWRFLRRGWTWKDAKDAEKNTEIAFEIWSEQGWGPWSARDCVGRSMGQSGEW